MGIEKFGQLCRGVEVHGRICKNVSLYSLLWPDNVTSTVLAVFQSVTLNVKPLFVTQ